MGGSHVSALLLIGALDRKRFEPVIALHTAGAFADYLRERGIPYVLFPPVPLVSGGGLLRRIRLAVACAGRLAAFLREQRIDIVHTNDARMHLSWALPARLAAAKFVWHQRTRLALANSVYFSLLAHQVFAVSAFISNGFSDLLRRNVSTLVDPVCLEPPLPDRASARADICRELELPEDSRLIAFVGNLREQKRPLDLVEAAGLLRKRYGDRVYCLFFGEERMPTAGRLKERCAELGLTETCRLMGPRFPIEPWLAGCDLFLAPAVNEGLGRVLVEAMLVGTPVIASADGGHVEIVEDGVNGLLVPPDAPSALAAAAIKLLDNPARAEELARAAQGPARDRYSLQRHVKAVQRCYSGLFAGERGGRENDDIVFIISDMRGGGAQRVAVNLIRSWIEQKRRVRVITWMAEEADFYALPSEVERTVIGPKPVDAGRFAAHLFNIKAIFRIRRLLRARQPRAVISFITVTNIFVILACLGLNCRLVISERNDPTRQNAGRIFGFLRRRLYRFADVVTANTRHAVDAMADYVPREKLIAVRNPVVLPGIPLESGRSKSLLSVGRLVPQKAQKLILEALALLGPRAADWNVEILGEGPEREALSALTEKSGLSGRVSLRGAVPDPDPHYRIAGIFVLSSVYEGTPNVLLEAMAHAMPCIVSDSLPGALEYIEDGVSGLVFRSGDAKHLAECMEKLMQSPELRARFGAAARRRVEEDSLEKVSAQWDEFLFP